MEATDIISSGMLELYAAGLTLEKESRLVEICMLEFPEAAAELTAIAANIEKYAQSYAIRPSPSVKEGIMAKINKKENSAILNIGVSPYWRIAAAASIVLLICSTILQFVNYNRYSDINKELAITRQSLHRIEEKDKGMEENLNIVQSRYSVPVALKGLEAAPNAAAKIFWMKNTGEVFIDASNLPFAPAGKKYQLWGIVDGKPVDGGMILQTSSGNIFRMQKMKSFGKAEAFAITLEPEKGNPTPNGPMYVMGKI